MFEKFRFSLWTGTALLIGLGASVATGAAIAPNAFIANPGMDGSTVSSPITFENFIAVPPMSPYTSVQFLFTINDECVGCSGTTDTAEVYYAPLSGLSLGSMAGTGTALAFATPCTFAVTIGTTAAYSPTCALSTADGGFLTDLENGGVSIVVGCAQPTAGSYQQGGCTGNLNDKFFFTGSSGSSTNASLTLLPQATVTTPEPSTALFGLMGIAVLAVTRLLKRSRLSDDLERGPVIRG